MEGGKGKGKKEGRKRVGRKGDVRGLEEKGEECKGVRKGQGWSGESRNI